CRGDAREAGHEEPALGGRPLSRHARAARRERRRGDGEADADPRRSRRRAERLRELRDRRSFAGAAVGLMRILGIDPGTRYFGYGVIERLGPGRVRYIECGVLQPKRGDELAARLADIA